LQAARLLLQVSTGDAAACEGGIAEALCWAAATVVRQGADADGAICSRALIWLYFIEGIKGQWPPSVRVVLAAICAFQLQPIKLRKGVGGLTCRIHACRYQAGALLAVTDFIVPAKKSSY
jgi:hypothetical protein